MYIANYFRILLKHSACLAHTRAATETLPLPHLKIIAMSNHDSLLFQIRRGYYMLTAAGLHTMKGISIFTTMGLP